MMSSPIARKVILGAQRLIRTIRPVIADGLPTIRGAGTCLFGDWARTGDEDIYKSPSALLPVSAGGHVGDTNESPKQIDWVEVLSHIPILDCALH